MKIFLILGFVVVGFAAGLGAGFVFLPKPEPEVDKMDESLTTTSSSPKVKEEMEVEVETSNSEYIKLNNQFVVPVVNEERVDALVVLSLSIEVTEGNSPIVHSVEPRLRDSFLRVLFNHANTGGFKGRFTSTDRMDTLKEFLLDSAKDIIGDDAKNILITDIARQDM